MSTKWGPDYDDSAMAWIMRSDRMASAGWNPDQEPMYPLDPPQLAGKVIL